MTKISTEDLCKFFIRRNLLLIHGIFPACSKYSNKRIDTMTFLMDLKGLSVKKIFSSKFLQCVKTTVDD